MHFSKIEFYNKSFLSRSKRLSRKDIEEIHFQKTEFYSQSVSQGLVQLRPGIRELLEKAKYNKKKLAISASTSRDNVTLLLRSFLKENPEDVFSFKSTGDLVEKKKPSPDLYKLVLAEMKLTPEECLAFEDSRIGLVSAKRANIKTAVNPSQYSVGDNFDEADYFLTSFLFEDIATFNASTDFCLPTNNVVTIPGKTTTSLKGINGRSDLISLIY